MGQQLVIKANVIKFVGTNLMTIVSLLLLFSHLKWCVPMRERDGPFHSRRATIWPRCCHSAIHITHTRTRPQAINSSIFNTNQMQFIVDSITIVRQALSLSLFFTHVPFRHSKLYNVIANNNIPAELCRCRCRCFDDKAHMASEWHTDAACAYWHSNYECVLHCLCAPRMKQSEKTNILSANIVMRSSGELCCEFSKRNHE